MPVPHRCGTESRFPWQWPPISLIGSMVPISLLANITDMRDGIRPDSLLKLIQLDHSIFIHIQICDLVSPFLQVLAGVKDGVVFNLGGYDVFSFISIGLSRGHQGPVIGLAASGREIYLIGLCLQ